MDVTRMSQLEPNVPDLAEVSETGLVTAKNIPGSVAIMARYQSHVGVFQALIPLGAPVANLPPAKNFVDELVFKQLTRLGLPPSPIADDATLIRRATIDIAGRLPTLEEVEQYLADKSPDKFEKLIDRLLASDDYADYFTNKWSAVLRNRRKSDKDPIEPTAAFHAWIRESLKENRPFDEFVRDVLTAQGEEVKSPPVIWYRDVREPDAQVESRSRPRRRSRKRVRSPSRRSRSRCRTSPASRRRPIPRPIRRSSRPASAPSRWTSTTRPIRVRASPSGWSIRRTRSSPRRSPIATGSTSSAAV
jgi:hypothetical protein